MSKTFRRNEDGSNQNEWERKRAERARRMEKAKRTTDKHIIERQLEQAEQEAEWDNYPDAESD